VDLYRAAGQLEMSRALAGQGSDGFAALADSQRLFALSCQRASRALAAGVGADGKGPEGQGLEEWLQELRGENAALAEAQGFTELREAAEEARAGPEAPDRGGEEMNLFSEQGTPISWHGEAGAAAPRLRLAPAADRQAEAAWSMTTRWLGLLGIVWFVALVPALSSRARRLWPEQLALIGALGWYLAGPTYLVLLLLVLGLGGRILLLARGMAGLLRRRRAPSTARPADVVGT
jgi:hypothetical protein